jgi:hypothetical protein
MKFIITPSIQIEMDGNTYNSNKLMIFFPSKMILLVVDLYRIIHSLHKKKYRVNIIIPIKSL